MTFLNSLLLSISGCDRLKHYLDTHTHTHFCLFLILEAKVGLRGVWTGCPVRVSDLLLTLDVQYAAPPPPSSLALIVNQSKNGLDGLINFHSHYLFFRLQRSERDES